MAATGNEIITVNGESITLAELVTMVYDILTQNSTDVGQFPVAASLTGINSLPAVRMAGNTAEVVTVSISLLKGADGKSIETQITTGENAAWQWRQEGGEWITLLTVADIQKPATDVATTISEAFETIKSEWETLREESINATQEAKDAASNVKDGEDGKSPVIENGTTTDVPHGQPSKLVLVNTGRTDDAGNPIYEFRADIQGGPNGKPFDILGFFPTLEALKLKHPDGTNIKGAFGVGPGPEIEPYEYYIWGYNAAEDNIDWYSAGKLEGAAGAAGKSPFVNIDGFWVYYNDETGDYVTTAIKAEGKDGKSAYQQAVDEGFKGNPAEWLESLQGKDGKDGKDGESWKVLDIDHLPGENDLTYVEGGETKPFPIGAELRFYDTEEEEHVFYKLYDITSEDKAVWKLAGSGGGGSIDLNETVKITLLSNQSQPDMALNGAVIEIHFQDSKQSELIWNGQELTTKIPMMLEYQLMFSPIEGYATPEPKTFTAIQGGQRNVSAYYNTCLVEIDVTSNQPQPDPNINNVDITVQYGETVKELTYTGSSVFVKVPIGLEATITGGSVEGYKAPLGIVKTLETASESLTLTYLSERVTINVSAEDGSDVSGQTVTVMNVDTNTVIWEGPAVPPKNLQIPLDVKYSVAVDEMQGMATPIETEFIASEISRVVDMMYEELPPVTTVILDSSISDPENITVSNPEELEIILSKWRRCLAKKTGEGKMAICFLGANNSNYYHDGTSARLDGAEGDWMVLEPDVWYKMVPRKNYNWGYNLSSKELNGYKLFPQRLVGATKASVSYNKLYSRSGVTPVYSKYVQLEQYAQARGEGYGLIHIDTHSVFPMLFYAKYLTRDMQAVLGAGDALPTTITGKTAYKGNNDTKVGDTGHVSFLGVEGICGCMYEYVSGVKVSGFVWEITDKDGITRRVTAANKSGWIKEVAAIDSDYFDMVPVEIGGSENTYYCDMYYGDGGDEVLCRSGLRSDNYGGVSFAHTNYSSEVAYSTNGTRLAFIGEIEIIENVEYFKALPVL